MLSLTLYKQDEVGAKEKEKEVVDKEIIEVTKVKDEKI